MKRGSEIFEGLSQSHVAQTLCLFESGDLEEYDILTTLAVFLLRVYQSSRTICDCGDSLSCEFCEVQTKEMEDIPAPHNNNKVSGACGSYLSVTITEELNILLLQAFLSGTLMP